ncbi:MAG: zinc ribbon domain-containing protein [Pseudomonadota bacterium]
MSFFDKLLSNMGGGHHGSRAGHGGNKHGYQGDPYGYPVQPTPPANAGIPCPACSVVNLPNARFCAQCGKSMIPASCESCKSTLAAGAKFCANCGKPQS